MPRIVTITFSPCIDKSTSVSALLSEKKLACASPKLEPGGGGINVARAIKKLGGEVTAIYPAGGYTGKYFIELLNKEHVNSHYIETLNETRENFIVVDESTNAQYRFGMPGTILMEQEWKKILQDLADMNDVEYIVASGSLPTGVPVNIFAMVAEIATTKKAKLIIDTSREALKDAVDKSVFLIKPNLRELSSLVDKEYLNPDEISTAARQIIEKGKCQAVVVSMGAEGALLVTESIERKFGPPVVDKRSTVGAGDSMVAGIVYKLANGESLENAVAYGVACGTAATMNSGTELCKKEDVERLLQRLRIT